MQRINARDPQRAGGSAGLRPSFYSHLPTLRTLPTESPVFTPDSTRSSTTVAVGGGLQIGGGALTR